jgi:hypothetical protein
MRTKQAKNKFANEGIQGVATTLGLFNAVVPDDEFRRKPIRKENGHGLLEAVSALACRTQQSNQKLSIVYHKQRIVRRIYDPLLLINSLRMAP